MSDKMSRYRGGDYFPVLFDKFIGDDFFSGFDAGTVPAVNVKETKTQFKMEVSAPGFDKGDFEVKVDKNVLTISASKQASSEEKDEDEKILRQEFVSSTFSRSFTLPENIDTEKIDAKEKNGVLTIKLPKKEAAPEKAVKKIAIK